MTGGERALATSLLLARINAGEQPRREHQLLERLQTAATAAGCDAPDLVTALYVCLKLHWTSIICGPARDRAMCCLEALTTTMVGADSGQTIQMHGPIGADAMTQRFAAVRLGDFVATALEQAEQTKAWFVLVDTPGAPTTMLRWLEAEVAAVLRAHGRPPHVLPRNLFVLAVAEAWPSEIQRCWLPLALPIGADVAGERSVALTPPVGYQRQLLEYQLTGRAYRRWLRDAQRGTDRLQTAPAWSDHASRVQRWLAASVDQHQQGLWAPTDPEANTGKALAMLAALQHVPPSVM